MVPICLFEYTLPQWQAVVPLKEGNLANYNAESTILFRQTNQTGEYINVGGL